MQALTLTPGMKDSLRLREIPDPPPGEGSVLVEAVALHPHQRYADRWVSSQRGFGCQ
ncbi:MAG: hypothetical protein ACYDDU_03770 [Dermatophilaceae bacterium]